MTSLLKSGRVLASAMVFQDEKNPFELLVSSSDMSGLAQVDGMTDQAGDS